MAKHNENKSSNTKNSNQNKSADAKVHQGSGKLSENSQLPAMKNPPPPPKEKKD